MYDQPDLSCVQLEDCPDGKDADHVDQSLDEDRVEVGPAFAPQDLYGLCSRHLDAIVHPGGRKGIVSIGEGDDLREGMLLQGLVDPRVSPDIAVLMMLEGCHHGHLGHSRDVRKDQSPCDRMTLDLFPFII